MRMQIINSEHKVVLEKDVPFKKHCRVSTRTRTSSVGSKAEIVVLNNQ